jgi:hypothetical protein
MNDEEVKNSREALVERYLLLEKEGKLRTGGLWSRSTREKMVGLIRDYGGRDGSHTTADFWQDKRDSVRTTLFDLELFINAASTKDVDLVMIEESLQPVIYSLLNKPVESGKKHDLERAMIAEMIVYEGFHYLSHIDPGLIRPDSPDLELIKKAEELSHWLTERFKNDPDPTTSIHDERKWRRERHQTPQPPK